MESLAEFVQARAERSPKSHRHPLEFCHDARDVEVQIEARTQEKLHSCRKRILLQPRLCPGPGAHPCPQSPCRARTLAPDEDVFRALACRHLGAHVQEGLALAPIQHHRANCGIPQHEPLLETVRALHADEATFVSADMLGELDSVCLPLCLEALPKAPHEIPMAGRSHIPSLSSGRPRAELLLLVLCRLARLQREIFWQSALVDTTKDVEVTPGSSSSTPGRRAVSAITATGADATAATARTMCSLQGPRRRPATTATA
mmetsp:Transcript_57498/g.186777  ORF Transcript_57498/g.186777 Transcript_57498/m.186777 type:complete len:260 (-) Transcript_57498:119-898(-)